MLVKIQYRRRNHFWDTQYIVLNTPDLEFSLFSYQLPDSLGPDLICRPTDLALQGPDTYSVITTS